MKTWSLGPRVVRDLIDNRVRRLNGSETLSLYLNGQKETSRESTQAYLQGLLATPACQQSKRRMLEANPAGRQSNVISTFETVISYIDLISESKLNQLIHRTCSQTSVKVLLDIILRHTLWIPSRQEDIEHVLHIAFRIRGTLFWAIYVSTRKRAPARQFFLSFFFPLRHNECP